MAQRKVTIQPNWKQECDVCGQVPTLPFNDMWVEDDQQQGAANG